MTKIILFLCFFLSVITTYSQPQTDKPVEAVESIDGIVNEVLNLITGKKNKVRDWEAFRNLFAADAQISVLNHQQDGKAVLSTYTLEEFVRIGKQFYEQDGFIEYEIKKIVQEYNGIANVFQSYYAKELTVEEKGINSYQLVFDGKRWWITNILWTSDRNGVELPQELQK